MKLSLALGTTIGFAFGLTVLFVLAFHLEIGAIWLTLVQVHGQAQIVGFVALFVMAVGVVLFPRFLSSPLDSKRQPLLGGFMLAGSVVLRAIGQPLLDSPIRAAMLIVGGVLGPCGLVLFGLPMARAMRRSVQPWQVWRSYAAAGFLLFLTGLVASLVASIRLAGGLPLVPFAMDEAVLHLELEGFVVLLVLTVALKIFPRFLILRDARERFFHPLLALYVAGVVMSAAAWLLQDQAPDLFEVAAGGRAVGALAEVAAVAGFCLALRLYEPPARPSGTPHITNPTRLWFRISFGWLLVAGVAGAFYAVREALGGAGANFTETSALRHAIATGFLLPLIAGMAGRILPIYSADVLRHRWLLPTTVWLAFAGAFARVGAEWLAGYGPIAGPIAALGGTLSTAAFLLLAVAIWHATNRIPDSP